MPRQMNVNAAYSPVGGKQQPTIKCSNFCISLLFTIIIVGLFMAGTGSNNEPHHEFQSGQATMSYNNTTSKTMSKPTTTNTYPVNNVVMEDENIKLVLEEATEEIQDAETAQLAVETKEIDTITTKITNHLRIGIGKLFGNTLSNAEMEDVAVQVQTQLNNEAQTSLRKKADTITNNAISIMAEKVTDAEDIGTDERTIEATVVRDQKRAVNDIKYGIDSEYKNIVQKVLPTRAIEIEKAILEERLSTKLGKRVKLVIDDDNEISNASNDDELFDGLKSFTSISVKSKPAATFSSGYSSSSSSSTSSTGTFGSSSSISSSSNFKSGSNPQSSFSSTPTTTSTTSTTTKYGSTATAPKTTTTKTTTAGSFFKVAPLSTTTTFSLSTSDTATSAKNSSSVGSGIKNITTPSTKTTVRTSPAVIQEKSNTNTTSSSSSPAIKSTPYNNKKTTKKGKKNGDKN